MQRWSTNTFEIKEKARQRKVKKLDYTQQRNYSPWIRNVPRLEDLLRSVEGPGQRLNSGAKTVVYINGVARGRNSKELKFRTKRNSRIPKQNWKSTRQSFLVARRVSSFIHTRENSQRLELCTTSAFLLDTKLRYTRILEVSGTIVATLASPYKVTATIVACCCANAFYRAISSNLFSVSSLQE